ncbi:allophanate hydrolase [Halobacillus halophilus]|uniref:allophanate hydrolase n=1 Tax=Halobacillus halophilus TaxID=1570 RepID=UPI0013692291|nr:allophanate hydrolase [Halobacillus halophilus]MYL29684.1 allophanate hydrolase [Halobacillus halophilus]
MTFPKELTIQWLKENYENGRLTPREVMKEIIQRSGRDEEMNIWITPPDFEHIEGYLTNLDTLDPVEAPLWGIPFAVKDNIDVAGIPTTAGSVDYTYTPEEHSGVVAELVKAGAVPVGKTNLDQFATGLVGTRSPFGEAHNALRPELISGGSSSGSAVAVARGQVVFSLGTDTAGSGRVPAALNNLVGYKPSLGAWSKRGVVPACESIDTISVFAHSLDDALTVDTQVRVRDERDPWSKDFSKAAEGSLQTFCLPKETPAFYGSYAADYQKAWEKAVEKIERLGVPVAYVDTELFEKAAEILYGGPWIAERWSAVGSFVEDNPGAVHPVTEQVLRSGAPDQYDAAALFDAMHQLQALKLEAEKLIKDAVLVMPTCGGTWTREQVRENPVEANSDMGRYTNHCNLLDMAGVSVPAGWAGEDLPFGLTLFSLAEQEHLMVEAAELFTSSYGETIPFAVCGLHMRGYPLETQMIEAGAVFVKEEKTAARYQLVKLPGEPEKPGMIKQLHSGTSVEVEIWDMPLRSLGAFTTSIPAPLGLGKVELEDGSEVSGFICEGYAGDIAEDISELGGWRNLQTVK